MQGVTFAPSLRFKLTAGVTLVMVTVVALLTYLYYDSHRIIVIRDAGTALTNTSQTISASLQHAMLQQDYGDLQSILDNVGQQPGIVTLMLLNTDSVIRFAPAQRNVGVRIDLSDPNCQVCHTPAGPPDRQNIVYYTPQGQRVLRNCKPIENQESCHRCHDASKRLNGVLITDFSMADTDAHLAEDLRMSVLLGAGAILVLIVTTSWLIDRLVLSRLNRVIAVLKRFGEGDLSQRLSPQSGDELGKLTETFNGMASSLQDKDRENLRLYTELQQKESARSQLLAQVIRAQEEERKRISRDLHDQLGATLSGLTLSIQAVGHLLSDHAGSLRERWQRAQDLSNQALEDTHKLILDLRPGDLDELGLVAAIRADAERRLQALGINVTVSVSGARRRLAPELELNLFRIAQEAINNIERHANARHVSLTFDFYDSVILVVIADDGQGFDVETVGGAKDQTRGLGLLGMLERAELTGGSLKVESEVGQGTRVIVTMPVPDEKTERV